MNALQIILLQTEVNDQTDKPSNTITFITVPGAHVLPFVNTRTITSIHVVHLFSEVAYFQLSSAQLPQLHCNTSGSPGCLMM